MVEKEAVRIIDASTAHRTAPGWAYGLPELSAAHREAIEAWGSRVERRFRTAASRVLRRLC